MSSIFIFHEPGGTPEELVILTANANFNGVARIATKREKDIGAESMWQFMPYQGECGALIDLRHGQPLVAVPSERMKHGGALTEAALWKIVPEGGSVRLISKVDQGRGISRHGVDSDVMLFPKGYKKTLWVARELRIADTDLPAIPSPAIDNTFYNIEVVPWDGSLLTEKRLMLAVEDEWGPDSRIRLGKDPKSTAAQFRLMPLPPAMLSDGKKIFTVDNDSRLATNPSLGGQNLGLVNLSGSRQFYSGDTVALRTIAYRFVTCKSDGKLEPRAWTPRANESFTIKKLTGGGEIRVGDAFSLRGAANGKYVSHDRGRNTVAADKDHIAAWETFTLAETGPAFHLGVRNRSVPLVHEGTGDARGLFQRSPKHDERDYNFTAVFTLFVPPGAPSGTFHLKLMDEALIVAPGGNAGAEEGEIMELRRAGAATLFRLRPAPPAAWPAAPDLTMEKYRDPVEDIMRTLAGGAAQVLGAVSGIPGGAGVFGLAFGVIWPASKVSMSEVFNNFRADILRDVKNLIAQNATFQAKGALESAHEQYLISYLNARRSNIGGGAGLETAKTYAVNAAAGFLSALNFLSLERDEKAKIKDTEQNVASAKAGLPLFALCAAEYINVLQETALLHAFRPALVLPDVRLKTKDQYVTASPKDGVRYAPLSEPLPRALRVLSRSGNRTLRHGDKVVLRSPAGTNVTALDGGGKTLAATAPTGHIGGWEEFTIERVSTPPSQAGDEIRSGDSVALRTQTGHYIAAPDGGKPLIASSSKRAGWETFTIEITPPPAPLGGDVPPKASAELPFSSHIENLRTFAARRFNDAREIFLFLVRDRQAGTRIHVNQQHSTMTDADDFKYDLWSQSFRDNIYDLDIDLVERKVAKPAGWNDFENHPPLQAGMAMYRQHLAVYYYYFKYRYFDALQNLPTLADETQAMCEAMWNDPLLATEYSYSARTAPRFQLEEN